VSAWASMVTPIIIVMGAIATADLRSESSS